MAKKLNIYDDITQKGVAGLSSPLTTKQPLTPAEEWVQQSKGNAFKANVVQDLSTGTKEIPQNPDYGESTYDQNNFPTQANYEDYQNIRANEEPWYGKIANGIAKGAVLAGTTFAEGTAGLLTGLANMVGTAAQGYDASTSFSKLWDNPFNHAMQAVNDWSEKAMPNYYSTQEKDNPWYDNIFTANFLGDKFLKNIGFTVGAAYSGGFWSKALQATRLPELIGAVTNIASAPANVSSAVGSVLSAVNEGSIEAQNNTKDWRTLQYSMLQDKHNQKLDAIQQQYGNSEIGQQLINQENGAYNAALGKVSEDAAKMGNMDLLLNIPILTASNLIQFGRFYANGAKTARRATNIFSNAGKDVEGVLNEAATSGISPEEALKGLIYTAKRSKTMATLSALQSALAEGNEEVAQQAASDVSGQIYQDDVQNFYKAKTDPESSSKTLDWIKSVSQGLAHTFGEGSTWEQGFIGFLTGALGVPVFGRSNTEESAWLGKGSPVGLAEGMLGKYHEFKEKTAREQGIADYLNQRVQSPEFKNYYQGLIRHNKYQADMNSAAQAGNDFSFKNAEHAQLVSDIAMFDNAGKLDDLKTLINAAYDTSPENIASIKDNTTTSVQNNTDGSTKYVGPFVDENGNSMSDDEIANKLSQTKDNILKKIDEYKNISNDIDIKTGQRLSDDQLEELTWMRSQINDWNDRSSTVAGELKPLFNEISDRLDLALKKGLFTSSESSLTDAHTKEKEIEASIRGFNTLNSLPNDQLSALLYANPEYVQRIKDAVDTPSNNISSDNATEYINKLNDIIRMQNGVKQYNKKLDEYLSNPGSLVQDTSRADEENLNIEANRRAQEASNILNQATTLKEYRDAIQSIPRSLAPAVINNIKENGSPQLKEFAENDEKLNTLEKDLTSILNTKEATPINTNTYSLIKESIDHANSPEEAINDIKDTISSIPEDNVDYKKQKEALTDLLDEYNKIKESRNTNNKDSNAPSKTPVKKKASLFSVATSEDKNEADKSAALTKEAQEQGSETPQNSGNNIIDSLKGKSSDDLKDLLNKEEIPDVPSDEQKSAKKLITKIYNDKQAEPVHSTSTEGSNTDINSTPSTKPNTLRSFSTTHYEIDPLKDRGNREAVDRSSKDKVVAALDKLGAYDFVDKGNLANIIAKNPNTPIHYLYSTDEVFKANPILLAIELNKENSKIGKPINPIEGSDGKTYQVIGQLGYVKDNKQTINNFNGIKAAIEEEFNSSKNKNKGTYVFQKFTNKVKHIYSGRMVKVNSNREYNENRSLKNVEGIDPSSIKLGFYYNDSSFKTPNIDTDTERVIPVNSNNANPREGSVWLMVKEADGNYYAKALKVQRLSNYDFNEHMDSPIVKSIIDDLKTIVDPTVKNYDRALAKYDLEQHVYFPNGNHILYNGDNVSIEGYKNNIGNGLSNGDKVKLLLDELKNPELNLRFQVAPSLMINPNYVSNLVNSDVLLTDLAQVNNVNSSFDVYMTNPETGELYNTDDSNLTGHTGEKGVNNSISSTTIYLNGNPYSLLSDGSIKIGNTTINDSSTKDEVLFMNKINNGEVKPIDGSSKLYIGNYSNGTEFGIVNGHKITDTRLEELKEAAKTKLIKEQQKKAVEEVSKVINNNKEVKTNNPIISTMTQSLFSKATMETPEEVDNIDAMMDSLLGTDNKTPNEKPINESSQKTTNISRTDTFERKEESIIPNYKKVLIGNRNLIKDLKPKGIGSIKEFMDFVNDPKNNLPSLDTITDKDSLETLINNIKECR